MWRKGSGQALGTESRVQVQGIRQQEAEAWMASKGVCGSGVGTSFVDMIEAISHRPGQDGDESNSSNVKERGRGLWRRVGEEDSVLLFFSEDLTFRIQTYLQFWGTREQDRSWGWPQAQAPNQGLEISHSPTVTDVS